MFLSCEGTCRAMIKCWRRGADVRHSPVCNTSELLKTQDAYVALGYLISQSNMVSMNKSAVIFKMSPVMDGTVFYVTLFSSSADFLK